MRLNLGRTTNFLLALCPREKLTEHISNKKESFNFLVSLGFEMSLPFFLHGLFLVWLFLVNLRTVSAWARQNRNILVDPVFFAILQILFVQINVFVEIYWAYKSYWNPLVLLVLYEVPPMCHHHCWCEVSSKLQYYFIGITPRSPILGGSNNVKKLLFWGISTKKS